MALLNNPMGALGVVNAAARSGALAAGSETSASSNAKPGDSCWFEGFPYKNMTVQSTVISPDGQICKIISNCDGVCNEGKVVATNCVHQSKTCEQPSGNVSATGSPLST